MMPWLLKIQIGGQNKKHRNIWIPLPLVYIPLIILITVLAPLLILGFIALLILRGTNMFKAIPVFFKILMASGGFLIDVNSQKRKFLISIK